MIESKKDLEEYLEAKRQALNRWGDCPKTKMNVHRN